MVIFRDKPVISVFNEFCYPNILKKIESNLTDIIEIHVSRPFEEDELAKCPPSMIEIYRTNLKLFYPSNYDMEVLDFHIIPVLTSIGFVETDRLDDRIIFRYQIPQINKRDFVMLRIVNRESGDFVTRLYCRRERMIENVQDALRKRNEYQVAIVEREENAFFSFLSLENVRVLLEPVQSGIRSKDKDLQELKLVNEFPLCNDCGLNSGELYFDWCAKNQCQYCYDNMMAVDEIFEPTKKVIKLENTDDGRTIKFGTVEIIDIID